MTAATQKIFEPLHSSHADSRSESRTEAFPGENASRHRKTIGICALAADTSAQFPQHLLRT
jgi:hypothetical protein